LVSSTPSAKTRAFFLTVAALASSDSPLDFVLYLSRRELRAKEVIARRVFTDCVFCFVISKSFRSKIKSVFIEKTTVFTTLFALSRETIFFTMIDRESKDVFAAPKPYRFLYIYQTLAIMKI